MNLVFIGIAGEPHPLVSMAPVLLMFVIFYFLMIRPQQKQQKAHKAFLAALEKNQEVVTSGGIHGTVVQVKDDVVSLRIADNVRIEVDRSAIARLVKTAS